MTGRKAIGRALCLMGAVVMLVSVAPAFAQTQGMERRDDRRDNRAGGRAAKQACKAGDEKTRAECRQTKRSVKHGAKPEQGKTTAPAQAPAN